MDVRGSVKRHKVRWALGTVAVVAAALVAGPYAYIHFIQGPAPAPLALTEASAEDIAATAPADLDGTWTVGAGSQAGYRVDEKIAGQANTAVGRTSAVTGEVRIAAGAATSATFEVDLTRVASDEDARDSMFQDTIMDTKTFPTASFTLTQPIDLTSAAGGGKAVELTVVGDLDLHGTTEKVRFTLEAQRTGERLEVTGQVPIVFAEHGVTAPSFGAATSVEDHGVIEFLLTLTKA
ncbi:hypothetical protein BH10ACT1_BH10ACT1_05700 [soil metagenome]